MRACVHECVCVCVCVCVHNPISSLPPSLPLRIPTSSHTSMNYSLISKLALLYILLLEMERISLTPIRKTLSAPAPVARRKALATRSLSMLVLQMSELLRKFVIGTLLGWIKLS